MPSALFRNISENSGFDDTDGRPWQMVPAGGKRFVKVTVIGPGNESWRVESLNPRIASVSAADPTGKNPSMQNVCRIEGHDAGSTFIIVRGSRGAQWGRLDVDVKKLRTASVQFFLVTDKTGRTTSTTDARAKEWVEYANKNIFEPQINVRFGPVSVQPIKIDEDLGDPIDFSGIGLMPYVPRRTDDEKRWHLITDKGDIKPSVFNVFCLWDFNAGGPDGQFSAFVQAKVKITAEEMAKSGANFNMCMMKGYDHVMKAIGMDMPRHAKLTFAHEAGHYLEGVPFHYENLKEGFYPLMRGDGLIGDRLLRRDADKMNKTNP
jgi:hypothetical protein